MLRRIVTKLRDPKAVILIFICIAILFGFFARGGTTTAPQELKRGITCEKGEWAASKYYSGDVSNCPDVIEYLFKPAYVNERTSELVLRFVTLPAGKFGSAMRNSGWVMASYFVDVDTTDFTRQYNKEGNTSQGATLRAKMSKENSYFYYPFDKYFGEIKAQSVDELTKLPVPGIIAVSDSSLSGWKLRFSEKGDPSEETSGKALYDETAATLFWQLSRANIVYIAVSILLILMLIALISAFAITRSIARLRRPPSMNLLLWLATVLFAILQVRTNFPGNPPVGILLDFTVVFPVLGFLLILGIANTFYWLKRTDWDYENENPELMKHE